jgi:hypothetical protein
MRDANGLQYHRARYYDPALGIWTAQDFLETPNRYMYASANPINRVDLNGLKDDPLSGAGGGPGPSGAIGTNVGTGGGASGSGNMFMQVPNVPSGNVPVENFAPYAPNLQVMTNPTVGASVPRLSMPFNLGASSSISLGNLNTFNLSVQPYSLPLTLNWGDTDTCWNYVFASIDVSCTPALNSLQRGWAEIDERDVDWSNYPDSNPDWDTWVQSEVQRLREEAREKERDDDYSNKDIALGHSNQWCGF